MEGRLPYGYSNRSCSHILRNNWINYDKINKVCLKENIIYYVNKRRRTLTSREMKHDRTNWNKGEANNVNAANVQPQAIWSDGDTAVAFCVFTVLRLRNTDPVYFATGNEQNAVLILLSAYSVRISIVFKILKEIFTYKLWTVPEMNTHTHAHTQGSGLSEGKCVHIIINADHFTVSTNTPSSFSRWCSIRNRTRCQCRRINAFLCIKLALTILHFTSSCLHEVNTVFVHWLNVCKLNTLLDFILMYE
jgi:hypothetical protein